MSNNHMIINHKLMMASKQGFVLITEFMSFNMHWNCWDVDQISPQHAIYHLRILVRIYYLIIWQQTAKLKKKNGVKFLIYGLIVRRLFKCRFDFE